MLLPLLTKSWRDRWRGLLAWTLGLIAMASVQLYVYPSVRDSAESMGQFIDEFPEAMQVIFRIEDYTSGVGFLNTELFSMLVPLVFIAVGASWGAGATADDEEHGTADLLLTLPVSRTRIAITRIIAMIGVLVALVLALSAALVIGTQLVGIDIAADRLLAAATVSGLLGLSYAGIGFLVGAWTGRRGIALGVAIALALAGFLAYSLAPLVDTFDTINPLNPFQWSLGTNALVGGLDPGYTVRLLALTAIMFTVGIVVFTRRDIRST